MRKVILLVLVFFSSSLIFAQSSYTLTGIVKDTTNLTFTQYTSAALIRAADSVLQTFGRADEDGRFTLVTDTPGDYILLLEHPNFASYTRNIDIKDKHTDLGIIPLISRKQLLQEVVISGQQAITIKGDTVEYLADSFKTRQYDNVDELLKKLPGLEVSSDGTIKAYGQKVEKMLVDGEEFFSDDPAMVAKTLRAAAVNTVQVFDKKSDQAEFTGIDDGQKIKTINLQLKEDAKRGFFGRVGAGGGLPGYWENEAMINAFKGKRKMAAYATMSNTNKAGLGWSDQRQYGSSGSVSMTDAGDMMISMDGQEGVDWQGNFSGQGLPRTWNTGIHYDNKWWGDTLSFNGSYSFIKTIAEAINNTTTQYILPDTQYINTARSSSVGIAQNHNISLGSEYKIDSTSSVRLTIGGKYGISEGSTSYRTQATSSAGGLINENDQQQTSSGDNKSVNASIFYKKKFRKKGRTFSANVSGIWNENAANGILQSDYKLFVVDSSAHVNQRKDNLQQSLHVNTQLTYTEPLSEKAFFIFNYGLNLNNQEADRKSFDRNHDNGNPGTDVLDSLYSSHYVFNSLTNQGGVNFRYNPSKKINFSVGGNIAQSSYTQEDKMFDTTYRYAYLNFFPRLSLTFRKSQQSSLNFDYSGRTRQPTLTQIQPLRDNNDPLNIAIGNPDLKQEFDHNFSFFYYNYKVLTSQSMSFGLNLSVMQNAISQKQNVDISGKRTYQYVNVNGNYTSWAYASYGRKIISDFRGYLSVNVNYNHTNNFINNLANENNTLGVSPTLSLSYYKDTLLSLAYGFSPAYNNTVSSIRTDVKTKYWTFGQTFSGSLHLPAGFEIGTDINWNVRQRLYEQDKNNNVFLWNAYFSKSFLKDRSLVLKIYANDILNQNIGYSRIAEADQISESTYNTIQRYFMLSLTWNFTKTGSQGNNSIDTKN